MSKPPLTLLQPLPDGQLTFNFHPGQERAWRSEARFPIVLAGTQSGKTVFGPCWLLREILACGPGDYLVVTPTFRLLEKKALRAFLDLFQNTLHLGHMRRSPVPVFTFTRSVSCTFFSAFAQLGGPAGPNQPAPDQDISKNQPLTRVYFGHAQDFESLESATIKAAWLDEVGQRKFRLESWEAVQRRLSLQQGRALFTTTPYNLGWFKQLVCDRAEFDPDYDLVHFPSAANPAFPRDELDRARRTFPDWKFRMFYLAQFERPAGLIYDSFNPDRHVIHPRPIPADWDRFLGLDFGGLNCVGLFYARDPETSTLYLYRTYRAGHRTAQEHVSALLKGEPDHLYAVGGAPSEDQWRDEFKAAGLRVRQPPISDVELGITRVYGLHKTDGILVFNDQDSYLDEKRAYARVLDDQGNPTDEIEDKSTYHHMDAERYIISHLTEPEKGVGLSFVIPPYIPGLDDTRDRGYHAKKFREGW